MGYSYDLRGRLCCDFCGKSGGVRRVKCPFGYCQADAACANCRKQHKHEFSAAQHRVRGCEKAHERFVAEEQAKEAVLAAGWYVRCAAIGLFDGTERVRVTFRNAERKAREFVMPGAAYDSIPFEVPATPDDYRRNGFELTEVEASGRTTKEIVIR